MARVTFGQKKIQNKFLPLHFQAVSQGKCVNHINPKDQDVKDFVHLPWSLGSVFSIYHHLFIVHYNFRINLFMLLVMPVYAACL